MNRAIALRPEQVEELEQLARHSPKAHVRVKARAVLSVAEGMPRTLVARVLGVERRSVGRWVQQYLGEGASALPVQPGRGRKARVRAAEVASYLRQAPSTFGLAQTRWTLSALRAVVPGMQGMTPSGVWRALRRTGYRYKRGQPLVHSPDPAYGEKRGP